MAETVKRMQDALQVEIEAYKELQKEIQKGQQARQKFTQQLNENEMVLKELNLLDEDSNVFKLIGPVLIKQDPIEAKSNVGKRLEFIQTELNRLTGQAKSQEERYAKKQQQILRLQQDIAKMKTAG